MTFGTVACVHQGRYYLGTKEDGILVFPLDGSSPSRITTADGLPSDAVQSLVCFEGQLYACLGESRKESYLVSWDLKERTCDVLASSRRKERRSPFDDKAPIQASLLLADPARGRLLLVLFSGENYSPLNGLWALDAKGSEWRRLLPLQTVDRALFGPNSRVEGDRLVFEGAVGRLEYDLAKEDTRLLFDRKVYLEVKPPKGIMRHLEGLTDYHITREKFFDVRPPHTEVDGWVWGAWPFSRRRYDSEKIEFLPPLRAGRPSFQPTECLQVFRGDRELLIGDVFGIWLVTLRKD